ncbi:MAG: CvpA family protein [Limisphaerales bacterium]
MTTAIKSFSLGDLPFGWFDFLFIALLLFGLYRGRKNGMTKEFIPAFRWVAIIIAAGLGYEMMGDVFHNFFGVTRATSYVLGYLAVAFVVFLLFVPVQGFLTPRLAGSNIFGGSEYYLGIFAGFICYLSIILFFLALMNAPRYSAADIQAQKEYAFNTFGGGQQGFTGDYFPTFQQVQAGVFKNSLVGPFIKDHLGVVLIDTAPAGGEKKLAKQK